MYKIIGGDGKEYGPVTIGQLRDWVAQGRINAQTRTTVAGSAEWQAANQIPELALLFAPQEPPTTGGSPPPLPQRATGPGPETGLAILSFILGLCSFGLCLSFITGIPAIICGHVARSRAVRLPGRYGGAGLALAGILLGYASLLFALIIAGLLLPAISKAKLHSPPQLSDCQNNLRQIGLAFKVWALDHNDQYPFNLSTNSGGTLELCAVGPDGFDKNAVAHFVIISNELSSPNFLVCPNDTSKHPAPHFQTLRPVNVSYQLRTGTNVNSERPEQVLAVCPVHGNQLFCDGNVQKARRSTR
jgi:hypothetical protein